MKCTSCGAPLKFEDRYCPYCSTGCENIYVNNNIVEEKISKPEYRKSSVSVYRYRDNKVVSGAYEGEIIVALDDFVYLEKARIGFSENTVYSINIVNEDNSSIVLDVSWKNGEKSTISILNKLYQKLLLSLNKESLDYDEIKKIEIDCANKQDETVAFWCIVIGMFVMLIFASVFGS